jgi:hypothetical protein
MAALLEFEARRLVSFAALSALLAASVLASAAHRRSLVAGRARAQAPLEAAATAVGPELALHAGSRWLRHPTRSEPWAYGHDGPGVPDADPAGAFAPPPRAALVADRAGTTVTRARLRPRDRRAEGAR